MVCAKWLFAKKVIYRVGTPQNSILIIPSRFEVTPIDENMNFFNHQIRLAQNQWEQPFKKFLKQSTQMGNIGLHKQQIFGGTMRTQCNLT